jgi:uncharacterized damage-inducible protein DinB
LRSKLYLLSVALALEMENNKSAQSTRSQQQLPEPWLRGTFTEIHAVPRAVLHALELAQEDLQKWCGNLTAEQLNARPAGLSPIAFHLRHIARSLDRLLTYARGQSLTQEQLLRLKTELDQGATHQEIFAELNAAFRRSEECIRALANEDLEQPRTVGARALPTTLGGLLVHVADHTQRHVGQAVTTAKVVTHVAERNS